ncbi:hypothetical protein Tco_0178917 [Tanacetum coccineum]
MDLLSFIRTADPTKVRVGERQHAGGEPRLLETTIGHVVPLLPVAPARSSSDLEASLEKLFDEGKSGEQEEHGDSVSGAITLVDSGEPSHPVKKLREDYRTPSGASPVPTLPFVTSSISATPERKDGGPTNPAVGLNLRTIGAPQRFIISSDSSYHSGANIVKAEVDSIARSSVPVMTAPTTITATATPVVATKEKVVKPSLFSAESTSAGTTDLVMGGFTDLIGSDILVGDIRTVVNPDSDI